MKRRSKISYKSGNDVNCNLQLFEHALKHAPSRNLILNLLASQDQSVFELFTGKTFGNLDKSTPVKRIKNREHCESPTALLRRRELEKINRPESAQSDSSDKSTISVCSSSLPFERILRNVTAYVEIKSGEKDRSAGAKALLKSMGATVCDKFSKDVTHVIFKDGSYQTYQRAKLLKVHFVSVLWLEAARRNGVRPPESSYPALGTKNYDMNVSLICSQLQKDYEEVIRDEIRRTLESGSPLPTTRSLIDSRRNTSRYESNSKFLNDQSSQDEEVENILQKIRGLSRSQEGETSSMILASVSPTASVNSDLTALSKEIQNRLDKSSDSFRSSSMQEEIINSNMWTSDSECGMVDGNFSKTKNVIDETQNMDITCTNESESRSLISKRNFSSRKTISGTPLMELTSCHTEVNTGNETSRSILKHLGQNFMNSVSYLASKANVLRGRESKERTQDGKENDITSGPKNNADEDNEFYQLKTPKLNNKKKVKTNIFSSEYVENSKENINGLSDDNAKDGLSNNKDSVNMSSSKISDFKQKTKSVEGKRSSEGMSSVCTYLDSKKKKKHLEGYKRNSTKLSSLHISDSSSFKHMEENKSGSTDMSTLHISSDSNKKKVSEESKRDSADTSSLHILSNLRKMSNDTSMSSLKLSKSSIEKSSSTNMSSLRISSEKRSNNEINDSQKFGTPTNFNKNDIDKEQILSTPFVTERKKRKNCRKSEAYHNINDGYINFESTKNDMLSSDAVSENSRKPRRENLAKNKEKIKFEMDVNNSKDFHDKNKEIEFYSDTMNKNKKINTTKSPVKILNKTPIKLNISPSSFVNTRSRRSVRLALEDEPINLCDRWNQNTPIRRKSVRLEQNLDQLIHEVIEEDEPANMNNSVVINSTPEGLNKNDTSTGLGVKNAVVILEDILVSPQKNKTPIKKPLRESRSETKLKSAEECLDSLFMNSSYSGKVDESQNEVEKIVTQPLKKPNFKISRTKSEPSIRRKSRRIRKLYNPDESISDELVNDTEERDRIRQEKITKNKGLTQCSGVIGNVLLTQKAMEYLEKNKNNQKELKTIFHSPESVLGELGIKKKREEENEKESILNMSSDEQVELAEEFVHKKRQVLSQTRKASQKTPSTRKSGRILSQKSVTADRVNRRSTLEFEPPSLSVLKAKTKLKLFEKPTIVCTKMHRQDVQMFSQIVRKLGTFVVEDEVTSRTTHLVVGEVKRTINMLRALARGCWILRQEWLLKSLEKGKWLPEDNYEVTEFSCAVQKCRLEKVAFGPSYTMNIFLNCGPIFVARSTTPRCSDLRELIVTCKGKVTKMPDNAVIIVGAYLDGCECVSEYWILDSISAGKLKPLKKYFISKESGQSPFV